MGTAGAKVTVASKLPFRVEMQCSSKRTQQRRFQGEVWTEEVFFKDGPMCVINGISYPQGQPPPGMPPKPRMVVGYALTPNVPKDLFDNWMVEHRDTTMVKNRLIFGFEQKDAVEGRCKENTDVDSGFGPLVPDTDRRMPKKLIGRQTSALPESSPDYSE